MDPEEPDDVDPMEVPDVSDVDSAEVVDPDVPEMSPEDDPVLEVSSPEEESPPERPVVEAEVTVMVMAEESVMDSWMSSGSIQHPSERMVEKVRRYVNVLDMVEGLCLCGEIP